MQMLIGTLFFISLAVFSDCIVPDVLAGIFQRHRQLVPATYGIFYYGIRPSVLVPFTNRKDFERWKVPRNGFIIGVAEEKLLRPIYDRERRPVIVRENGGGNTRLTPEEFQQMPYHSEQILEILPGFGQILRRLEQRGN